MFLRARNPFSSLVLSCRVWVTLKIQVNFRYRKYLEVLMIVSYRFLKFLHYLCSWNQKIHCRHSSWAIMLGWTRKSTSSPGALGPSKVLMIVWSCNNDDVLMKSLHFITFILINFSLPSGYQTRYNVQILIALKASFFTQKCTKIVSGWGFASDPTSLHSDPLIVWKKGQGIHVFLQTSTSWLHHAVHDVIDFKCTTNSRSTKKCTIFVGGWPDLIFRTLFNDLQTVGVEWLRIRMFTKFNFLATPPRHDMVDFNSIKTFLFDLKNAPISLAARARARPPTPQQVLTSVLHTVGEDGVKDELASNLNFLATQLWWIHIVIAPTATFLI